MALSILEHTTEDGSQGHFLFGRNAIADEKDEEISESDVKSNDPVRLYLRKMGSVSLLTREGEVQIAQRIEAGERQIVRVYFNITGWNP